MIQSMIKLNDAHRLLLGSNQRFDQFGYPPDHLLLDSAP